MHAFENIVFFILYENHISILKTYSFIGPPRPFCLFKKGLFIAVHYVFKSNPKFKMPYILIGSIFFYSEKKILIDRFIENL